MGDEAISSKEGLKDLSNKIRKLPRIILASASPRRMALLGQILREFEVVRPSAVEIEDAMGGSPESLALINAYNKAASVAKGAPEALVIGADTVVALDSRVFGKPRDMVDAKSMLMELRGKTHRVITGVALIWHSAGILEKFAEVSSVTFKEFSEEDLDRYLKLVNPLDKAGAYAIQEHSELIVESYSGSWSNIVGLPVERLMKALLSIPGLDKVVRVSGTGV